MHVDKGNVSRIDTCGLDPEDAHWLQPSVAPASKLGKNGEPLCSVANPRGVEIESWVDCVDGDLEHRFNLKFVSNWQPGNYAYSCIASPKCVERTITSAIICYKRDKKAYSLEQKEGAAWNLEMNDVQSGLSRGHSLGGVVFSTVLVHIVTLALSL